MMLNKTKKNYCIAAGIRVGSRDVSKMLKIYIKVFMLWTRRKSLFSLPIQIYMKNYCIAAGIRAGSRDISKMLKFYIKVYMLWARHCQAAFLKYYYGTECCKQTHSLAVQNIASLMKSLVKGS